MKSIITREGLALLQEKLKEKKELLRQVQEEKAHAYSASGDGWHDNPGWTQLGQQEEMLSGEIVRMEQKLAHATLHDRSSIDADRVQIGCTVSYALKNMTNGKEARHTMTIVGAGESDIRNQRISYDSPIGKALYNLKATELKEIALPNGRFLLTVINVHYE